MRLVLLSDTHDRHTHVQVPEGDILIHAGDLTMAGDYQSACTAAYWLRELSARFLAVVVIAGNHDWLAYRRPTQFRDLLGPRITYLENEAAELDGLKFYGSPITPWFNDWAFNVSRGEDIRKYWDRIPKDTDVLITHGPPLGVLDQAAPHRDTDHLGCGDLAEVVYDIQPKLHVFGHIHGGYGMKTFGGTAYVNASIVNEAYQPVNRPWVVDL